MKLITFTVPCYNSAAYMDRCVETLLPAGEEAEIILVDDGSKDDTGKIADAYAEKYPNIVKVIHQENGGHGEGVNQGIRNASGMYFKVVDSDDWLDAEALQKVMQTLRGFAATLTEPECAELIRAEARYGYAQEATVKPGVEQVLAAMHARGVRMCVASGTETPLIEAALTSHGLMRDRKSVV